MLIFSYLFVCFACIVTKTIVTGLSCRDSAVTWHLKLSFPPGCFTLWCLCCYSRRRVQGGFVRPRWLTKEPFSFVLLSQKNKKMKTPLPDRSAFDQNEINGVQSPSAWEPSDRDRNTNTGSRLRVESTFFTQQFSSDERLKNRTLIDFCSILLPTGFTGFPFWRHCTSPLRVFRRQACGLQSFYSPRCSRSPPMVCCYEACNRTRNHGTTTQIQFSGWKNDTKASWAHS